MDNQKHNKGLGFLDDNSRKKRCLIAFMVMLMFFLPYAICEPFSSDTNDDTAMNLIAAGAFGENSQYLVYINVLYGYFLKMMYALFPAVNWYLWIALFCNAAAVAVLGAALAYFLEFRTLVPALILLHFYMAGEFYRSIQFTRNAYLYALCGMILILMGGIITSCRKAVLIAGGGFLFLAFLIRKECLVPMVPFFGIMLLRQFGKEWRKYIPSLILLLCTGIACGGAALADRIDFREREEWRAYYDYHFNGTYPLLDDDINHWFSFDPEHMDFELNDLFMVMEYQYADFDYFSVDYLEKMRGNREQAELSAGLSTMWEILREINRFPEVPDYVNIGSGAHRILYDLERLLGWNICLNAGLLAFAVGLVVKKRLSAKEYLWIGLLLLCMLADLLAVIFVAGHTPRRATIGFRMAFEILTAFVLLTGAKKWTERPEQNGYEKKRTFPVLAVGVMLFFLLSLRVLNYATTPTNTETGLILEELRGLEGEYYLLDGMLLWGERLGITDLRRLNKQNYGDYFAHFALSGGWLAETPHAIHYMREQAIGAPMLRLGEDARMHYVLRAWKAEQLVPMMTDYLSRRQQRTIVPKVVYFGDEIAIVDFYGVQEGK